MPPSSRNTTPIRRGAAIGGAAMVVLLGLGGVAACSAPQASPPPGSKVTLPTFTREQPASQGASCDDAAGDISNDANSTKAGTLSEPAGADLTHFEARLEGSDLVVKITTVGDMASAPKPVFTVFQGSLEADTSRSWQVQFRLEANQWKAKLSELPKGVGQRQTDTELPSVAVVVEGNTLTARLPRSVIPVIGTTQWLFGSSAGVSANNSVFDDCIDFTTSDGGPGTTSSPATSRPGGSSTSTTALTAPMNTPITGPDGIRFTVLTIDDPAVPNREVGDEAIPDNHLAAVELEVCATTAQLDDVGDARVSVVLDDGSGRDPWPAADAYTNDPRFPIKQTVRKNECVKGWMTFEIGDGKAITEVRYNLSGNSAGPYLIVTR